MYLGSLLMLYTWPNIEKLYSNLVALIEASIRGSLLVHVLTINLKRRTSCGAFLLLPTLLSVRYAQPNHLNLLNNDDDDDVANSKVVQ